MRRRDANAFVPLKKVMLPPLTAKAMLPGFVQHMVRRDNMSIVESAKLHATCHQCCVVPRASRTKPSQPRLHVSPARRKVNSTFFVHVTHPEITSQDSLTLDLALSTFLTSLRTTSSLSIDAFLRPSSRNTEQHSRW